METFMQQAASEWAALCSDEVLGIYVENVTARDDRICYTFDGFIQCVIYHVDGIWVVVGDHSHDAPAPEVIDGYRQSRTIEGLYQQLRKEFEQPYDHNDDLMGMHMGRNE